MKKIAPVIWVLVMSCQSWDRTPRLMLYNKSTTPMYFWISCDSSYGEIQMTAKNCLNPGDSVMPYLLYGPEGKGPDEDPWINAINNADDSSLHCFCVYVDFINDPNLRDSLFNMIIKRSSYKVDSLKKLNWKISCR